MFNFTTAQYVVETLATLAFALSGVIEAARRKLDAVGVFVVAGLAAFGGGTLRDILLDRRPFFWVQHSELLWLVFVAVIASLLFLRGRHLELTERAMQWPDAVGLGLFAASGTQIGLSASVPPVVAIMMGVITAVFGGVLRDIVCNDIPKVFSDHRPYALCAFLGGVILVIAHSSDLPQWVGLLAASIVAAATRILAMIFNWQIPAWRVDR